MKTVEEIRQMLEDIRKDIPKYTNNSYMSDRLWTRLEMLKWVLDEEQEWHKYPITASTIKEMRI